MYPYTPHTLYHPPVPTGSYLRSQDVHLVLRQQPKEALVTTEGKEKARKPVDPPPIIQLQVKPHADPAQHFLQSPYLFMCTSLYKPDKNEAWEGNGNKSLAGSLVSSLHRLKDVDNKDGGFFVFGDISVKVQGTFRLHFSLFDLRKDTREVVYLGSITSEPFRVLLPKDFKGMDESTYLSRAFSDQGVRLRLRKEPRAMIGNKRAFPYGGVETNVPNTPIRPNMHDSTYYPEDTVQSPVKRFRSSDEETTRKIEYPDHSTGGFPSTYAQTQYPVRQPSIGSLQGIPQYNFGAMTSGSSSPFSYRPSIGSMPSMSSLPTDSLLPTSGAGISSQQRYSDLNQSYPQMVSQYPGQERSWVTEL